MAPPHSPAEPPKQAEESLFLQAMRASLAANPEQKRDFAEGELSRIRLYPTTAVAERGVDVRGWAPR